MVSDKPPRRSRSGKTPVTIDLPADQAVDNATNVSDVIAEPTRSDDTDRMPSAEVTEDASRTQENPGTSSSEREKPAEDEAPAQSAPADGDVSATPIPLAVPVESKDATTSAVKTGDTSATAKADPIKADTINTDTTKAKAADPKPDVLAQKPSDTSGATSAASVGKPTGSPFSSTAAASSSSGAASAQPGTASPGSPPPAAKGPSGAALAATGIIGGVVALLLAGSMQYAGYLPGPARSGDSNVSAEIADLRTEVEALRSAPAQGANGDVSARLQALETSIGNNGTSPEVTERLSALQSEMETLRSATQNDGAAAADLGQRLSDIEARLNRPGPEQAVARALSAAALKAATERGGSFAAELDTFAGVASDDPAVEGLRAYATEGVPTRADLVRRLPAATDAMMDALHQPAEGEGIASRLLSSAMRVVKVRPVGDVAGDTPEAVVARMEERVKTGNLQAAVSEWNALPEAARQASQDFKRALDARIKVDELASGTLTRAMTSTGTAG
jgi:hypothetical protein